MTTRIPVYCAGDAVVAGSNGVPATVQVDLNGNVLIPAGTTTGNQAIASGTTAATTVKASAGRLCRILIQATVATAAIEVFDNPSAASGTVIGYIPVGATAGMYDFEMPAANGITVGGASTNPPMTISYY